MNSSFQASSTSTSDRSTVGVLLAAVVLGAACAAASGCAVGSTGSSDRSSREGMPEVTPRSAEYGYYQVTRPDYRKCMWPLCGGVFVRRVNQAETECLDGTLAADCYVADIDLEPLGLADDAEAVLDTAVAGNKALVRGKLQKLVMQNGEAPVLVASEGWLGRAGTDPAGGFFHVVDSGIVCITWPCPVIKQLELNIGDPQNVAGLDLAASGADGAALSEGQAALSGAGLLVAGSHRTITGPAGDGLVLDASEFYTRAGAALPVGGEPCGQSVCGAEETCCNPSCGMCAAPGEACIELACAPCAHGVCDEGGPLSAGCDQCVGEVCADDPFCCDTAWDELCVQQGAQACGSCDEPEPLQCVHSECSEGESLAAPCSPCAAAVCQQDAFCCDTAWDGLCVEQAIELCDTCEPPAVACVHSECQAGAALEPSCSSCAGAVCGVDAFCCAYEWDSLCVQAAEALCAAC